MKKFYLFAALAALTCGTTQAQTVDGRNFGIDGFAACSGEAGTNYYLAGGTTGGAAGKTVYANTFSELQAYLQATEPYTVIVDHNISTSVTAYVDALSTGKLCDKQDGSEGVATTYGERILIASNKTLLGVANAKGEAPLFERITFVMQSVSNIIIRNVRFTMNGAPILKSGENKIVAWRDGAQVEVGDPDCISIQADKVSAKTNWGGHIWIDHCEFFNGNADNKDRYDGLLDCKNNVQWMTFSYNYFHDHDKACLFGKGDGDVFGSERTISFHHNYFNNIEGSRLPLQRGSYLHYMNNYQNGCQDGWDIRTGATAYLDACYFKDTKSPVRSDRGGSININKATDYDCVFTGCNNLPKGYTNADGHKISKSYAVTSSDWLPTNVDANYFVNNHDKTADVPAICEKYSGAGKIVVYSGAIPAEDLTEFDKAANNYSTGKTYDEKGNTYNGVPTTEDNDATAKVTIDGASAISKTVAADDDATTVTIVVTPTRTAAKVATTSTLATAASATNTWTVAIPEAGESVNVTFTVTAKDGSTTQDYTVTISRAEAGEEPDPTDPEDPTESTVIYSWNEGIGTTVFGNNTKSDIASSINLHSGKDNTSAIKIGSSADYLIIKPATGGFKKGDVIYLAGAYTAKNKTNTVGLSITTTTNDNTTDVIYTTPDVINAATTAADPAVASYTLTADYDALYIWRSSGSTVYITTLYATRVGGGSSDPTAIKNISSEVNDCRMYDLLGRRISQPRRGHMFIMNGKKYIKK